MTEHSGHDIEGVLPRQITRREFVVGTSMATASVILAACTPSASPASGSPSAGPAETGPTGSAAPSAAPTGSLTMAFTRDLMTSPDNKTAGAELTMRTMNQASREGLTTLGTDLAVLPRLAKSFELTTPTEWTVTLRDRAIYSDGTPVTVEDVAKAIQSYKDTVPPFIVAPFPEWPEVQKIDDTTFKLTTKKPFFALDRSMAQILILPAAVQRPGDVDDAPGSGAFKIDSFDRATQTLKLVPNEKYNGPSPAHLASVTSKIILDEATRYAALAAGEVDIIHGVSPDGAIELEQNPDINLIRVTGTRLVHFFYNFRSKGPLANPKVREALTYAIDGDKILETILLGSASALKGPIPDTLFGAADVGTFSYDPDKAKSMLADAGVPEGFEILMLWGTGEFFSATQIMETVREMLGAVGVNATLKEFQPGAEALATQYGSGELDWDVYANGIGNNTGDAFDTLIYLFAPTADLIASNRTYRGFNVPEITNLINTAATEPDLSKRLTLLTEAQEAIWGTWPMMWGFTQNVVLAHRKRVSGIEVRPIDFFDLSKVTVS